MKSHELRDSTQGHRDKYQHQQRRPAKTQIKKEINWTSEIDYFRYNFLKIENVLSDGIRWICIFYGCLLILAAVLLHVQSRPHHFDKVNVKMAIRVRRSSIRSSIPTQCDWFINIKCGSFIPSFANVSVEFRSTSVQARKRSIAPANIMWWDTRQIDSLCYRNSFFFSFWYSVFCSVGNTKRLGDLLLFLVPFLSIFMCIIYTVTSVYISDSFWFFFSQFFMFIRTLHVTPCSLYVHICEMQSVIDLEIPSISVNWIHIPKLSTRAKMFTFKHATIILMVKSIDNKKKKVLNSRHFFLLEISSATETRSDIYIQ